MNIENKKNKLILALIIVLVGVFIFAKLLKNNSNEALLTQVNNPICEDCNILIFTLDTLRADHLSTYGYDRNTSPKIDSFANQSIQFNNHYSQYNSTTHSHWSIMTALYAHTHKMPYSYDGFKVKQKEMSRFKDLSYEDLNLPENIHALPIVLKNEGYVTSAFVTFPIVTSLSPMFDEFELSELDDTETTRKTIDWLERNKDKKFFLWTHLWDAHEGYEPAEEYDIYQAEGDEPSVYDEDMAKYDGEIRSLDHNVDLILSKLDELNLSKKTIVILTADHGESFGEYDCTDFTPDKNGRCRTHWISLFDPEINVPLIIKVPGIAEGREVDQLTQSVDIFPTMLELLGINRDFEFEGESLLPLIVGGERARDFAFSETYRNWPGSVAVASSMIRQGDWKLIVIEKNGNFVYRLHNLKDGEELDYLKLNSEDVDYDIPKIFKRLKNLMLQQFKNGYETTEFDPDDLDEGTRVLLESLGYL